MTLYSTIADSEIDPESPGTTTLFTKLRDNPIAITEKAAGAPVLADNYIVSAMITDGAVTIPKLPTYTAGNYQEGGTGTYSGAGGASYNKKIEIIVPRSGTVTTEIGITPDNASYNIWTRVYVNGSAVGTERHVYSTISRQQYDENISVTGGDLVQVYTYSGASGADTATWDLAIKCGNPLVPSIAG